MAENFVYRQCPVCGIHYALPQLVYENRAGKSKSVAWAERCWYCPNGHSLAITEPKVDQLRAEHDRLKQQIAQRDDEIEEERRRTAAAKGQITKLKKRVSAGVCPCCNRTFQNLQRHMKSKHPDFGDVVELKQAQP